jgi:hypothetical protein
LPSEFSERPNWHGTPVALDELFVLYKNRREAKAVLSPTNSGGRCG